MSAAVDVVVVAYRSRRHLPACVEPLLGDPRLNVLVVDNACPEGSGVEAERLGATVLRNERNVGFGAACNQAAATGDAPAILLLNPDAVIDVASAAALAARLDEDPGLGAVGPRLVRADGSTERSIGRAPRAGATLAEALYVHRFVDAQWASEFAADGYDRPCEAEWLVGACLCVRRSAYDELGGFDESFFLYGEDVDLCLRLRDRGWRIAYDPHVTALHHGSGSGSRLMHAELVTQGRVGCARRHTHGGSYAGLRVAIALHDAIRLPVSALRGRAVLRSRLRALSVALRP